jgi:hypothetical protein
MAVIFCPPPRSPEPLALPEVSNAIAEAAMAIQKENKNNRFGMDVSRLSPELRDCFVRLETLEQESEKLFSYMSAELRVQRAAWRAIDGGR